jgi:NADPH-dependent 2,4-dienoyl-CoA reductase/sulfur reductase-like enzyme
MAGFDELPLPQALLDTLDSATHVADVVTAPVMTPLLTFAAAAAAGTDRAGNGAGADEADGPVYRRHPAGAGSGGMKSWDVIVIGSGAAGFAAAVTACCKGLSVLMLEKAGQFGGTSAISGGAVWLHDTDQARARVKAAAPRR